MSKLGVGAHNLEKACFVVKENMGDFVPEVGVVLGSGLGRFAEFVSGSGRGSMYYQAIPHCPDSRVVGHCNKLHWGYIGAVPVIVAQGRVHYYEGYSMEEVVFVPRLMALLGAEQFILTHAVGSIRPEVGPGSFYLDTDHLSFNCPSPLLGENDDKFGKRFPDMSEVYDKGLRELALARAKAMGGLTLHQGVAGFMPGPQYETPAEIRALKMMGADFATMSTVPEAIALRHMNRRVLGIACATNFASGVSDKLLDHDEVMETARVAMGAFCILLKSIIVKMLSA